MFLRQPVHPEDFIVAPIIRYMPLSCTTTGTDEGIEPLTHSVWSEATNHLVHQQETRYEMIPPMRCSDLGRQHYCLGSGYLASTLAAPNFIDGICTPIDSATFPCKVPGVLGNA